MTGIVKFYDKTKGWGFITAEEKEFFIHHSNVTAVGGVVYQGQKVSFDKIETERGVMAVNIKPVEDADS